MNKFTKLNEELKLIGKDYNNNKQNTTNNKCSQSQPNNESLQQLINQNIQETNKHNDRLHSFMTDNSLWVNQNNNYLLKPNKINQNTTQQYYQQTNNTQNTHNTQNTPNTPNTTTIEDENNYNINQLRFDNIANRQQVNRISPFTNHYQPRNNNGDITNQRLNEYSPLGRSMAIPVDIEYQINETFKNSRTQQHQHKSDITNQRLSQLSPLAKSSNLPVNNKSYPNNNNNNNHNINLITHLNSTNSINQTALNTNYKEQGKNTKFNENQFDNINSNNVNTYITNYPKNTRFE